MHKLGLHAWFEQQLNAGSTDDAMLDRMLLKYPAMQLNAEELAEKFPSPLTLRRMARANAPLPTDPAEHAIYADAMEAYRQQMIAGSAAQKQAGGGAGMQSQGAKAQGSSAMDGQMEEGADAGMADSPQTPGDGEGTGKKTRAGKRGVKVAYTGMDSAALVALPPAERMAAILAMPPDQELAFNRTLPPRQRRLLMADLSPAQEETLSALQGPIRTVAAESLASRLLRDVYSERQLEAVMTDFWLNHFNVYVRKNQQEPFLLNAYERDTIRPHALGKFEDLLVATAKSPAMLVYLDNWQSVGPDSPAAVRAKRLQKFAEKNPARAGVGQLAQNSPKGINENYARELMELHTIGVRCEVSADHTAKQLEPSCGAGYTQADVTNVAKVLTGWTIDRPYGGGGYTFAANRHQRGEKMVLGQAIADNGEQEGLQVLHMLATSPATAQFLAHKLAVRFLSDTPPPALEARMAVTFLSTQGDIKAVLRTLFDAPEFWSPAVYRAKVKTPVEFVVSALRASDARVENALPLVQAMDRLGMPLYGMQTPNGYSWLKEPWVNTTALVSRMNFSLVLTGNLLPGTQTNWPRLLGESDEQAAAAPPAATEAKLETLLLGDAAPARTRATVLEQAGKPGQAQEARRSLALSSDDMGAGGQAVGAQAAGVRLRARRISYGGQSMTDMAAGSAQDGPVNTMAGLLLGSPEFQRR